MQFIALTSQAVRDLCRSLPEGQRVRVKYVHNRDTSAVRTFRGALSSADADDFLVRASSTSVIRIPSEDFIIISFESMSAVSVARDDAEDVDRQPQQPTAERTQPQQAAAPDITAQLLELFRSQAAANERQLELLRQGQEEQSRLIRMSQLRNEAYRSEAPPPPPQQQAYGDVEALLRVGDAIRGQDNPVWRLCPGLLLPRFLAEKFHIVSIPHLLFKEDPISLEMVRVPKGTAFTAYKAMLSNCKMQFPNQIVVKMAMRNPKGKDDTSGQATSETIAGVRAQMERSERMFSDLLLRLDQLDTKDLPNSKQEWMMFLDAGVAVLELYSTLANGFVRGGGKLSQAYSKAITSTGRFDPSALFSFDSKHEQSKDSFR